MRADYIAANIGDPDGYNIEIAYKPWLYKQKIRAIYPGDEFKGNRVLVTGGTKGIGAAIAGRLELSGASVATTARSESAAGQAPALSIKADLGTARGVQNVVDRIQREWGGLDVLVNNVGGTETKPGGFEVLSDEDWQRSVQWYSFQLASDSGAIRILLTPSAGADDLFLRRSKEALPHPSGPGAHPHHVLS